jgi:hypothetical protein
MLSWIPLCAYCNCVTYHTNVSLSGEVQIVQNYQAQVGLNKQ